MTDKDCTKTFKPSEVLFWLCCAVVPIALLSAVCVWNSVYPFGEASFLTEDLKYQYIDFFSWFRRVLLGQTTVFYEANTELGVNAWGLVGYYLSSPFNLLLIFFDEDHLTLFFWVITALKLACTQIAIVWYLRRRFSLPRGIALALGLCFVWSVWTASQLRNPLWLDALIILPIIEYAVYYFVRSGHWVPLAVTYALAVIVCWYTAYMIAVFTCLFFILEAVVASTEDTNLSIRAFIGRIPWFALALLVALLLAAFTFLPTILAMIGGSGGTKLDTLPLLATYPKAIVASFFLGNWTLDVHPQHYAGTFVTLLALAFFCIRDIPLRVKLATLVLLLVMVASSFLWPLVSLWGGMRVPAGFYCRFAFLTVFLMVWMAGYAIQSLHTVSAGSLPIASIALFVTVTIVAFLLGCFLHAECAVLTMLLSIVYFFALAYTLKAKRSTYCFLGAILIGACIFVELLFSAHLAWQQLYLNYDQDYHDSYVAESRAQIEELASIDDGLYRIEKTYTRVSTVALNEGMVRDYLGLSTYASSQNRAALNMLCKFGYSAEGVPSIRYADSQLLMDSLLGVKYVSAENRPAGFKDIGLMRVNSAGDCESAEFYLNPYALPLAYGVSADAIDFTLKDDANPFESQNQFASALVGEQLTLFHPLNADESITNSDTRSYQVRVPAGAIGYAYVSIPSEEAIASSKDGVWLSADGKDAVYENYRWRHAVTAIDDVRTEETTHTVCISRADEASNESILPDGSECLLYYLDLEELERLTERLLVSSCDIKQFEAGYVEMSYQADSDGFVMLTIPAAEGWTATVNGIEVALESTCDSGLMVIPVNDGENRIVLKYLSPGFQVGCVISFLTLVVLLAYYFFMRRFRRGVHNCY